MLKTILKKSLMVRRIKIAIIILSIGLGSAIMTGLYSMSVGIDEKFGRELRVTGANIIVTPQKISFEAGSNISHVEQINEPSYLNESDLSNIKTIFWANNILDFAPILYGNIVLNLGGASVTNYTTILAGTWFGKTMELPKGGTFKTGIRDVAPWWDVEGNWIDDGNKVNSVIVGSSLAEATGIKVGDQVYLDSLDNTSGSFKSFTVIGIVHTGSYEDHQVIVDLGAAHTVLGCTNRVSKVLVSALVTSDDDFAKKDTSKMSKKEYEKWYCTPYINSIALQIKEVVAGSDASPIKQVAFAESVLMAKMILLMLLLSLAGGIVSVLSVMTTGSSSIIERKREVGLMKALGATRRMILSIFLSETIILGLIGGFVGYFLGSGLAQLLGKMVFDSGFSTDIMILPVAIGSSVLIALVAILLPLRKIISIDAGKVMRGE